MDKNTFSRLLILGSIIAAICWLVPVLIALFGSGFLIIFDDTSSYLMIPVLFCFVGLPLCLIFRKRIVNALVEITNRLSKDDHV